MSFLAWDMFGLLGRLEIVFGSCFLCFGACLGGLWVFGGSSFCLLLVLRGIKHVLETNKNIVFGHGIWFFGDWRDLPGEPMTPWTNIDPFNTVTRWTNLFKETPLNIFVFIVLTCVEDSRPRESALWGLGVKFCIGSDSKVKNTKFLMLTNQWGQWTYDKMSDWLFIPYYM